METQWLFQRIRPTGFKKHKWNETVVYSQELTVKFEPASVISSLRLHTCRMEI